MGEDSPQPSQHDGRLSLLPILTERKVGPSRFPFGWQQVANRSRLDSRSLEGLASVHRHIPKLRGGRAKVFAKTQQWLSGKVWVSARRGTREATAVHHSCRRSRSMASRGTRTAIPKQNSSSWRPLARR